jgi:hypothetical protein
VSDDGVIGGFSTSKMELVRSDSESEVPFLRWSGNISTEINRANPKSRHITRSGFAAILSPEYPMGAPLGNKYKALEICCRTDGRTYAVNLHVETYFPDDMYQGFIGREGMVGSGNASDTIFAQNDGDKQIESDNDQEDVTTEPNQSLDVREYIRSRYERVYKLDPSTDARSGFPPKGFTRLILPFMAFTLTSRGRARMEQRDLDGAISIESIGFTLMDGRDGDFNFDLVSIRAINILNGEVVGTLEDDEREEAIARQFMEEAGKLPKKKKDDTTTTAD